MAAGTVLEPPLMYQVRPYFEIKKVRLPNCMYHMKPLHKLAGMKIGLDETVGSALSYLEQRQEWVLDQISQLQKRVQNLGDTLGVSPEDVGVLSQAAVAPGGPVPDIVISCPPSDPPYALLSLCHCISRHTPVSRSLHVHSSVSGQVSTELMDFWKSFPTSTNPVLKITLLWKSPTLCSQPTMVVSPHNQTPVSGLANILRYICREFCPKYYEGCGPEQAMLVDSWLDSITGTYVFGSSKEKLSVLRRLNSHLGSSEFLAGSCVTLADIVAYAVICRSSGEQKLTDNVKKWIKSCQSLSEFQGISTN